MNLPKVLVYETDYHRASRLCRILESGGYVTRSVFSRNEAEGGGKGFDIIIASFDLFPLPQFFDGMDKIISAPPAFFDSVEKLAKQYNAPCVTHPYNAGEVLPIVGAVAEKVEQSWSTSGATETVESDLFPEIIGNSPQIKSMKEMLVLAARSDSTILILGETGTGKELVASAIHRMSKRSKGPFVAVNCGAFAEGLLETELFGHERGAFTGAVKKHMGKFELSDGGTLFLDEVGEMSKALQQKLLRVLEQGNFYRVGGELSVNVDVRVVCATNRDIFDMAQKGEFRRDLLYRLNVLALKVPSLRSRGGDKEFLARIFLDRYSKRYGKSIVALSEKVVTMINEYTFPGNVRELMHAVEQAVLRTHGDVIDDIEFGGRSMMDRWNPPVMDGLLAKEFADMKNSVLEAYEKEYLDRLLALEKGSLQKVCKRCGLDRKTLYRKMKQYGLDKKGYK
ncbi:MAG: sigma-54 dependent transcriptional regulator [Nitrospinota bacterium]|nr:sigma-54 dependent transcriptional regulator [Nitrospinota bacterium]